MNTDELKGFLDFKADMYESVDFIETDPILIPHQFTLKEDIEISAFLVASIAWGNRKAIIKSGNRLMELMGNAPFEFIMEGRFESIPFVHRTFNGVDLQFFLENLKLIYENGGLEKTFSTAKTPSKMQERIHCFRTIFMQVDPVFRSGKHISDPMKNSACKRINMFLRWMVRSDAKGVDFGLWKSIDTSELMLPLDVHTGNNARRLGLLERKQNDWKALEELMLKLREMNPNDPVKYDFALFGLGAFEGF